MKGLTIIIPVGEKMSKDELSLLSKAFKSAEGNADRIIVIGGQEAIDSAKKKKLTADFIVNETPSLASNINKAVKETDTDFFSVLEFDDEYTKNWFRNVEEYLNFGETEKSILLPLAELVDENGESVGYANEAFWASSFSEELGYADISSIENYLGFLTSGGVFRKKDFVSVGGLKESMKLVFWYEFLLRALYKEKKVFVVPKVGYLHRINREDSLSSVYEKTMSEKEAEWWLETAGKEYFFPQDRNKVYEEE